MKCAWCQLLLPLVLIYGDGTSQGNMVNYYMGPDRSVEENLNEATRELKGAPDMRIDTGRKRVNISALSASARKLRSVGSRHFRSLSPLNGLLRVEADNQSPPEVRQQVKSKRGITPIYSISSDKYNVNISCHLSLKRSCALPDAAFIFKQMPFSDEETTPDSAGTENIMGLLTYQECSYTTANVARRNSKDKHRVIGVEDEESKSIVKDALAFESSQVTKMWGEHGRAGPVVPGELRQSRNSRKRRSPDWTNPYKQVLFKTERLITKCKALTMAAKHGKFVRGLHFGQNETDDVNSTGVIGESKKCVPQIKITTSFPHKGHWCHFHHKYNQDPRTKFFHPIKVPKMKKTTAHETSTASIKNKIRLKLNKNKPNVMMDETTLTTKGVDVLTTKSKNVSPVDVPKVTSTRKINSNHKA